MKDGKGSSKSLAKNENEEWEVVGSEMHEAPWVKITSRDGADRAS